MWLRELVRGRLDPERVETVARAIAERYDREVVRVEFVAADNWLSTPLVVDDDLFVKVISRQNAAVHALFTAGRNLGAFSSGREGFFERFESPYEMARHELEATERIRELGVAAPEPVEAFEVDGLGVLVLEYLPAYTSLGECDPEAVAALAPALFDSLRRIHGDGLAHGDLRAENVLVAESHGKRTLHFVDATRVSDDGREDARAYDLACGLAALAPAIGAADAVDAAAAAYDADDLRAAHDFLPFVTLRPDHEFDFAGLTGELEKRLDAAARAE